MITPFDTITRKLQQSPETAWYHLTDDAIPSARFNSAVRASDIIYLAYINFQGFSNVLTKAAHFGKPVLASKDSFLGRLVEKSHLGVTVEAASVTSCLAGIRKILEIGPEPFRLAGRALPKQKATMR